MKSPQNCLCIIGDVMNIETLYENEQFNNLLFKIASDYKIYAVDAYKQDVFLEILNKRYKTMKEFKRAAITVEQRYYRKNKETDVMDFAYMDDSGQPEADHEVMARLVYDKKARYV